MDRDDDDFEPFGGRLAEIAAAEGYLGSAEVVDAILRGYLDGMLKLHARAQAGEMSEARVGEEAIARARAMGRVFLGLDNDPGIQLVNDQWNRPGGGIVRAVRGAYNLAEEDDEAVLAYPFLTLLGAVVDAGKAEEEGESAEWLIDAAIEKSTLVLTGAGYA